MQKLKSLKHLKENPVSLYKSQVTLPNNSAISLSHLMYEFIIRLKADSAKYSKFGAQ